jgi:molybdopterin converting factor subunit 1
MHKVKVLFFATLRDYAGAKSVEVEIPLGATVEELTKLLVTTYPHLEKVKEQMMAAINREYASNTEVVPKNAEIAYFPPVSGG